MGYLRFGNRDVQEWAFNLLNHLITDYQAEGIKVDFNLDPGPACNRGDHGHALGDGISMLAALGFSQRLPDLPQWIQEKYQHHIQVYKQVVSRFVANGDLYHLSPQTLRFGQGERWAAFQYVLPDTDEHLVCVFRMDGPTSDWTSPSGAGRDQGISAHLAVGK